MKFVCGSATGQTRSRAVNTLG